MASEKVYSKKKGKKANIEIVNRKKIEE